MAVSPDGSRLYVVQGAGNYLDQGSSMYSNNVSIIDIGASATVTVTMPPPVISFTASSGAELA